MKKRIAVWAIVGFAVAGFWAFYFAREAKDNLIGPFVYALAGVTQPIVLLIHQFAVSFYWVLLLNAVTYALIGLVLETLRRQLKDSKQLNTPSLPAETH